MNQLLESHYTHGALLGAGVAVASYMLGSDQSTAVKSGLVSGGLATGYMLFFGHNMPSFSTSVSGTPHYADGKNQNIDLNSNMRRPTIGIVSAPRINQSARYAFF